MSQKDIDFDGRGFLTPVLPRHHADKPKKTSRPVEFPGQSVIWMVTFRTKAKSHCEVTVWLRLIQCCQTTRHTLKEKRFVTRVALKPTLNKSVFVLFCDWKWTWVTSPCTRVRMCLLLLLFCFIFSQKLKMCLFGKIQGKILCRCLRYCLTLWRPLGLLGVKTLTTTGAKKVQRQGTSTPKNLFSEF